MERFLKRKLSTPGSSSSGYTPKPTTIPSMPTEVNLRDLPWDPSERKIIWDYHPDQRDEIRRKYLIRGPCQPRGHDFPKKMIGNKERRFSTTWFDQYAYWLEYSIEVDKAFCLCCYLFKEYSGKQSGGDTIVTEGFCSWNKSDRLALHMGDVNSSHNKAFKKCQDLMKQDQSIAVALHKQSDIVRNENRIRLNASIDAVRYLLKCALPFRGHDEFATSIYKGNFLELLYVIRDHDEYVRKVTLENAPGNNKMVSTSIQKDIVHCFAQEILKSIFDEIGTDVFALLVDESSDISKKEQMVVVLRYVTRGIVKERFVGLVHVKETSSLSLKSAIESFFNKYKLSFTQIRGQGYDGASNMRGEFNGLKALIMRESSSAYYVHCFAHQLQLVVVAVAKKHHGLGNLFDMVAVVMNVVCASCKQSDMIRESQKEKLQEEICSGEKETGTGLNQELSLTRPGDTRWSSHYKTLLRLANLFSSVVEVLDYVVEEGVKSSSQRQAIGLEVYFCSFDFVFYLHLMLRILGITNALSQALQKKDQDILSAIILVKSTTTTLQQFRDDGFNSLMVTVSSFCEKHDIGILNMEEAYVIPRKPRQMTNITNGHHYEFDCFKAVLDMQMLEFRKRFTESTSELLICMASLSPRDSFIDFNPSKLEKLVQFYASDFSDSDKIYIVPQLLHYISYVRQDEMFANLNGISDLARVMVETKTDLAFLLLYRLLKLTLVLPVATATVERCFSAMKLVKSDLRNRIADEFLSICVICAVENEALVNVTNENVVDYYFDMKIRREQL